MRTSAAILCVILGLAVPAGAEPFTGHFDGLETELNQRRTQLEGTPGRKALRQLRAVNAAEQVLDRFSDALATDLVHARRVAARLTRVFRNDLTLDTALHNTLDGLRGDVADVRDALAERLLRLPESRAARRAARRLAQADKLLARATTMPPRAGRARVLQRAFRKLDKAVSGLDASGTTDPPAGPAGARAFKTGPIAATADGRWVWVVNPDNGSVSRIDALDRSVREFVLPAANVAHDPRGLAVTEDGSEVWVACHGSDRVYVLDSGNGAVLSRIDLAWGSGPHSIALSPDQGRALVSLFRAEGVAALDTASRSIVKVLRTYRSALGMAWTEDGSGAWVSHVFTEEHGQLTRIDWSGAEPFVAQRSAGFATDPRQSSQLAAPHDIAEGGYLSFRGHFAQIPTATGKSQMWLPTQYNNIHEDRYSPDSTVQATLRHIDLTTGAVPNSNADKVILTAVHVHDPMAGNAYVGPGWDARISGPIDLAFSADGTVVYVLCEHSNDLTVVPTDTPAAKPQGAAPLTEIPVGDRPMGVAVAPAGGIAYVMNRLSRDVSVVDLGAGKEIHRVAVTPLTGEPFSATHLRGAKLFHTSDDDRISHNRKVACASCHIDGEHDGRSWDLQHLPGRHGPRTTQTLLGLGLSFGPPDPQTGFGQLHHSGDRDEVQDFEHTFQGPQMGGTGFLGAGVNAELGTPNAGRDADLDALAQYVLALAPPARSPSRAADGSLTEAAVRGATFFVGESPQQNPADASCAACHVPETHFTDLGFHDVGSRRGNGEEELNHSSRSPYQWRVNTPTLRGVWTSGPYDGVAGFADNLIAFVDDIGARNGHGTPSGLTGRQLQDFVAFLSSIDGDLTAEEVRNARDTTPPRVVRFEAASLTQVDVWFSETVARASAEDLANWDLLRDGTTPVPITAAVRDDLNGDRVTLTTQLTAGCPTPITYTIVPGPILDAADSAGNGVANALDTGDASNRLDLVLGDTLTVTFGASGNENHSVYVHDTAMVSPGLSTWSHDSVQVFTFGQNRTKGFIRFDWRDALVAAGVTDPALILDAQIEIRGRDGNATTVQAHRCLQPWDDPATGGHWNRAADGAPSWRDHQHPNNRWNQAGARQTTPGVNGQVPGDYGGGNDIAHDPDVVARLDGVNETLVLTGTGVADAFRFWFSNPSVDFGYAIQHAPGSSENIDFWGWERELRLHGPVLTITYELPGCP